MRDQSDQGKVTNPSKAGSAEGLDEYRGVWVFVEVRRGKVAPVSWQLVGAARGLAQELETEVGAVVLGHQLGSVPNDAIAYGADKVYLIDDPVLATYRTHPYTWGAATFVRKYKPEIFVFGGTTTGRDLAASLATELPTGLAADATQLGVEKDTRLFLASRPDFGGKLMSTILCRKHRPQMASVRAGVLPMPPHDESRKGEIIQEPLGITEDQVPTKVLAFEPDEETVDLGSAKIIVSGGRGLGGPEPFRMLEDLASEIGGVVGASRAAVNAGWIPYSHQVGQTGQTVRPRLYMALGISGAIQHMVGMQESDVIVAVNQDPQAPIFRLATYGVAGDLFKIVPALTEAFREMKRHDGAATYEDVAEGAALKPADASLASP